jgi:U6 snRNA-associated Sm-like protein LSm1
MSAAAPNPPNTTPPRGGRGSGGRGSAGRGSAGRGPPRDNTNAPKQLHLTSGVPHGHVPAYLPGSASLVEELDKRVLVVLRDGKHLVGVSRSDSD